ncbi:S9 family peptidase [candidate division KSB1 bacterium]
MKHVRKPIFLILFIVLLAGTAGVFAQEQADKRPLTFDDYMRWRSISGAVISDDGNWFSYGLATREKDDTLYVKSLSTEKEYMIPYASSSRFSDDAKWIAYTLNTPAKEAKKLQAAKKPVPRKAQLMNLTSGEKYTVENAASFTFSKGSKYLAVKKPKSDSEAKHNGTDLLLRNLETSMDMIFGNVADFSFNKPGTIMAYTIDAADTTGNGLYIYNLTTGQPKPLDTERLIYERLTWNEEGSVLALLKGNKPDGFVQKSNVLIAVTGLDRETPEIIEYDPAEAFDFPKDMVISEKAGLSWSEDLTKIFFGIKEQEKEPPKKKDDDEPVADVDIWHVKDDRIQSVQMIQASRDRNFTFSAVFDIRNKRFVRLADEDMRRVTTTRDGKWAIGQNDKPYVSDWKPRQADYYRVDTESGERTLIFKAHERTMGLSPDSKHYLYWKDGQVWDYVIASNEHKNLTQNTTVTFEDVDYDHPGEVPPYGVTGWTKDGKNVILTHKYDLWVQPLDGSPGTNLTQGVGSQEEIRFRYVSLDREERFIDLSKPVLLTAYGQWTKKSGYYELKDGKMTQLIFEDKSIGRVTKAENTGQYIYTIQTFADFPDYYVSDTKFTMPKRLTDANPFQSDYKWGHRILFDFTNNDGVRLQGTLAIPDDYVEGQRLPMHVNYYEKNSQNLHRYVAPRIAGSPNFTGMVSNGYLCMQPDIHLRTGRTHSDMLECIEAAVKKCVEMGYADPDRVSLHGHSFSGQGSAFASTHSDMFAAIVYGAGATDLVADFNQLWKSSGTNQHRYDIYGQGRFGTNPFDDLELYIHESATFNARDMNTPLLIMHGTEDGSVEWLQAVEFYNALRFNDKNVILLSYPGAGHGLRKLENQRDFQTRARQFLDHYLKDKPMPDWMINGIPFIKKKK